MSLLALQDLFRHHRERASGLWRLGVEPNRTIYFDSGDVVFATSTHPTDRLTYLLVERGKLTQAQLDYALANLKPGISIGKNLIEMGFITQRDLLDVARAQVERVVQGALGTPDQEPEFEAKDLDATVVRLPLDTPQLLLNGMLNLQDRERLLELLGPLNQVVVLQGRRLMELSLPPDLAKLPPLLDGTHTLLELSRESLAEPLRLGTFALFLREIGWARLHEMPPLDRQALDMALTSELEPLSPPLPEPPLETVPSLFSTIEAAARPTTNLEHLSQSLDELPEPQGPLWPSEEDKTPETPIIPEPVQPPPAVVDASGFSAESGQALLPTPNMELPEPPMAQEEEPEPPVVIAPSTLAVPEEPVTVPEEPEAPEAGETPEEPERTSSRGPLLALVAFVLALAAGGAWWWFKIRTPQPPATPAAPPAPKPVAPPAPQPTAPQPATPEPAQPATPEPPKPEPPKPQPAAPEPPKPQPAAPEPPKPQPAAVGTSAKERVEALVKGDLVLAIRQGQAYAKAGPQGHWSLRLEIACQGDTLSRAAQLFPEGKGDVFVLPIQLRDGRTCYQVFYGKFPSQAAAEKQTAGLPKEFREGGNKPKAFRISELPTKQ